MCLFEAKAFPLLVLLISRIWHSSSRYNFSNEHRASGTRLTTTEHRTYNLTVPRGCATCYATDAGVKGFNIDFNIHYVPLNVPWVMKRLILYIKGQRKLHMDMLLLSIVFILTIFDCSLLVYNAISLIFTKHFYAYFRLGYVRWRLKEPNSESTSWG